MVVRHGLRNNLVSAEPTRQLNVLVDPECLSFFKQNSYENILQLIIDLKLVSPSVEVAMLVPSYLANPSTLDPPVGHPFQVLSEPEDISDFLPNPAIADRHRKKLLESHQEAVGARNLMALAKTTLVDALLTSSNILLDARYPIYQHEGVWVIPIYEFADLVEIFAHGHCIFWSASYPHALNSDVFYILTHWKNKRLSDWWRKNASRITNDELKRNLNSALLNRYPFILYARDMIRFYQLQKDYCSRRGINRFSIALSYHVNFFHLLLWGMLDQLTVIAKDARSLEVEEWECGIGSGSKNFWREFRLKEPQLARFVKENPINEWIKAMAALRHAAAHKSIPMPTRYLAKTEESEKSDEDILELIKKDDADLKDLLNYPWPDEVLRVVKQQLILTWRIDKMRTVADHVVTIKTKDGEYLLSPVISVDFNLAMLTAVMDAFLVKLFSNSTSAPYA